MKAMSAFAISAMILLATAIPNPANAQSTARTVLTEVAANRQVPGVEIGLRMSRLGSDGSRSAMKTDAQLAVGDPVVICFDASREGYVTVWNQYISDEGLETDLLYPNQFSRAGGSGRAEHVIAGKEICVGDDPNWRITVSEPAKEAKVLVHWTQTIDDALPEDSYPKPMEMASGRDLSAAPYATRTISYSAK